MQQDDLKSIKISFERAKDSKLTGYKFLKNPPQQDGGGLRDQVVMIEEELTMAELIEDFVESSTILSDMLGETASYIVGAVFSLVWNSASIDIFPDKYKEILDLIDQSAKEETLNMTKLNELIEQDHEVTKVLDALIEQKYLRKKNNGDYVVRKKIIANVYISFLQVADDSKKN